MIANLLNNVVGFLEMKRIANPVSYKLLLTHKALADLQAKIFGKVEYYKKVSLNTQNIDNLIGISENAVLLLKLIKTLDQEKKRNLSSNTKTFEIILEANEYKLLAGINLNYLKIQILEIN